MNRRIAPCYTSLILGALLASGAAPIPGFAQSGSNANAKAPAEAVAGPLAATAKDGSLAAVSIVATVADLAWLEGTWRGEWGPRVAQLVWMAPQAGVMTGAFSLMETDKVLVIELFTIAQTPTGVELNIRHFTPDLMAWEKGDPTRLTLSSFDDKRYEFDNAVDGKPKRSILSRIDADTYISRSEIAPDTGNQQVIEITYHRIPPPSQPAEKNAAHRKKS
ncbi:MAG: DUF6265 family protein [Candidatus Acidiferrales bacterium]